MKTSLRMFAVIVMLFCCQSTRAWNCSDPLAARVPVPAGTKGTFGNGDGQLFLGTGSEGTKGQLYECEVPKTPGSGDPGQKQKQGQSQTATGGNATSGSSSTATGGSVTASGNSSNKNTNTSNSTSSASNNGNGNGNGSNNASFSSTVEAPKIPVQTAYAPPAIPTAQCFKGMSGGAQTMAFGASFGGGKIDQNCAILEAARSAPSLLARCKVYVSNKYVKKAGVTVEDCVSTPPVALQPVSQPVVPTPQAAPIVVPITPVAVQAPIQAPVDQPAQILTDLGVFKVTRTTATGVCPSTKVALGPGGISRLNRAINLAKEGLGAIILTGSVSDVGTATRYVKSQGISRIIINAIDDSNGTVQVQVWTGVQP